MTRRTPTDWKIAKKQAWASLSQAIRLEQSDNDGFCTCVTCGAKHFWKNIDAGHLIGGRRESFLWEEAGIHPQCYKCNRYQHANSYAVSAKHEEVSNRYSAWMEEHYSRSEIDRLWKLKHRNSGVRTADDYVKMRDEYDLRIKAAKKKRQM